MLYPGARNSLVAFCMILVISCAGDRHESSRPATEQNVSAADTLTNDSDFINYSSDAVTGAVVYIPVYSHIFQQSAERTFNLTATLSIRNTDLSSSITIRKIYYYDSEGNLVKRFLNEQRQVKPLSSISHVVEEDDLRGGVGANFLVLWEAQDSVNQPVIEAVMISTAQSQGISFVGEGRVIHVMNSDTQ